jgi:AcrR family transcriptional regulator
MNIAANSRPYKQSARSEAAAKTGWRIVEAFLARMSSAWMDEITLNDVAHDAGVTVQTVVRRFGGKEGLTQAAAQHIGSEIGTRLDPLEEGDWRGHVEAIFADYERTGDLILRLLAQEERWLALKPLLGIGRATHRARILKVYRPYLDQLSGQERETRIAALVMLTDVYSWRLLRRDQGLGHAAATRAVIELVGGLIGTSPKP